ncbi:hypothetical protein ACFL6I_26540 [candidate division KSB1 bacterium]
MRILHIAPLNYSGVPYTIVQAEKSLGFDSRLITLSRHPFQFPEDICLDLPFVRTHRLNRIKNIFRLGLPAISPQKDRDPPFKEVNPVENILLSMRDFLWSRKISRVSNDIDLDSFDVYHLIGGMPLYYDARLMKRLAQNCKIIISTYLGSDLRVRGVYKEIHQISSCNFTVEYDHMHLYHGIHIIPFPFDFSRFDYRAQVDSQNVVIGHAPSYRRLKGTDTILEALRELKKSCSFEICLIENESHDRALELKSRCSLFIDQISDLGYGINAVESMAMAIPTFSSLRPEFKKMYPDHPFIEVTAESVKDVVAPYLHDIELRRRQGNESRKWVMKVHDARSVVFKMHSILADTVPLFKEKLENPAINGDLK